MNDELASQWSDTDKFSGRIPSHGMHPSSANGSEYKALKKKRGQKNPGTPRVGQLPVKVPVQKKPISQAQFDSFMTSLVKITKGTVKINSDKQNSMQSKPEKSS